MELATTRLVLRQWRDSDRAALAAINADPRVMQFFPAPQSRESTDAAIDKWRQEIETQGFSNWAVERRDTGELAGFVGLTRPWRVLPFTPCVEIGWRLGQAHWGQGLASEAARAALAHGFGPAALGEIVSFTARANLRSMAVMERIGMRDAQEDFDHPALAEGHWLRRHCLYRLTAGEWARQAGGA